MIGTKKLNIVLAILLAAVIATASIAYYAISRIDALVNRINTTSEQIEEISLIQPAIRNTLLNFMSSSEKDAAFVAVNELDQTLNQQFGKLELLSRHNRPQSLAKIKQSSLRIVQSLRDINNGNPNAFAVLEEERDQLDTSTQQYIDSLRTQNTKTLTDIGILRNRFTLISISIVVIALAAFFLVALPTIYSIGNRIDNLNQGLAAIGRGAMGIRVAPKGNDALTAIEQTLNDMAEKLQLIDSKKSDKANYLESEVAKRSADLAAANSRLRTIDQNRKEFIVELAHALKTPLTVARASIENTANLEGKKQQVALTRSLNAIDDVTQKTQELLQLAQREDGLVGTAFTEVELYELLDSRVASFTRLNHIATIELSYDGNEPLIIHGQKNELIRLFDAIIENATQHTSKEDNILIEAKVVADDIVISITDTGTGISGPERERLFERFYTMRPDGTGIGLAMARRIATEHGGSIEIGDGEHKGTKVHIRLPKRHKTNPITQSRL